MSDTESKNVVKNTEFKTQSDWINKIFDAHCLDRNVGAVEAVEAVTEEKDDDGNIVQEAVKAVRGKKGKDVSNVEAIEALARANNITLKEGGYPNVGMTRMNVGNMLRAAARKRHGLMLPTGEGLIREDTAFEWVDAPSDFEVNETKTHSPDGSRIVVKKPEAEAAE